MNIGINATTNLITILIFFDRLFHQEVSPNPSLPFFQNFNTIALMRRKKTYPRINIPLYMIETPPNIPMSQRLLQLHQGLSEIILLHHPEASAVEKLFFQRNVKTAISVGQARGVALLTLAQAGLSIAEYSPLEIKQAVAGYGGADKKQVQQMVKALLEMQDTPRPDDAADALAVAICHIHSAKMQSIYDDD